MLLDGELRAAWKAQAKNGRGPVVGAIALCEDELNTGNHARALYMGAEWGKMLQACLVAWAATDKPIYAQAAMKFFKALLDDLDAIGDGAGGDKSGSRDMGYPIRNLGPYTALAYDWLHDLPEMTPALRQKARERWAAWLGFFAEKGYHPRDPGSNYHAGYLIAATMIAIAQGGEAAEEKGPALWKRVADELWGKDMAAALKPGGALEGGDWIEGWQYAPLAVAEYSLAARIAKRHGIPVDGITEWLGALLRRHVHALTPSDRVWAGGDYDDNQNIHAAPSVLTLVAIALGDAAPQDKKWARGELVRLQVSDRDWLLYDALAAVGDAPALPPRAQWPTWYHAAATATLYARSSWDADAIWFVAGCAKTDNLDHRGPNAGNFALARGANDLVVDPSPYGSLSTLTSNAPTVLSKHLPANYQPSQGAWGSDVGWAWATKTTSGVVAARCDYSDAYRFQQRPSDVEDAVRDFVLVPTRDGKDATLVVVDRAKTGEAARKMYLRFRVPGELAIDKTGKGTVAVGDSKLTITGSANATRGSTSLKDCFKDGTERGKCDAARVPVTDYRVEIDGPSPRAVHVLEATAKAGNAAHKAIDGDGWQGVHIQGTHPAVVVWPKEASKALTYRAPRAAGMTHVVLDAPALAGKATVVAKADGDACAVTVTPGGVTAAAPVLVTLDDKCAIAADPEELQGSGERRPVPVRSRTNVRRGGCCDVGGAPSGSLALAALVLGVVLRRRRR